MHIFKGFHAILTGICIFSFMLAAQAESGRFSVTSHSEDGRTVWDLQDRKSNSIVSILPDQGANCIRYRVGGKPILLEPASVAALCKRPLDTGIPLMFPFSCGAGNAEINFNGEICRMRPNPTGPKIRSCGLIFRRPAGNVLECPEQEGYVQGTAAKFDRVDHDNKLRIGYAMNQYLNYISGGKWYGSKLSRFKRGSEVFAYWDASRRASYYLYVWRELEGSNNSHPGSVMLRHKDGVNTTFIDGHVEFLSRAQMMAYSDPSVADNITRWVWMANETPRPFK
jgi:prepilin-type processing-associated H-X9-DG protein